MSEENYVPWRGVIITAVIFMALGTAGMLLDGQELGFAIKWGLMAGPGYMIVLIVGSVLGVICEWLS
jgi:hypothetical protein